MDCSDSYLRRWSQLFKADRWVGLFARYAGRRRYNVTDLLEARVLAWTTTRKPADGSTHWSLRKLVAEMGCHLSHMTIARIWAKHGLKLHRLQGAIDSNDLDFETKVTNLIDLYLNPPKQAAVFCVDEKTAIQTLDCKNPLLPLLPGRAEQHGFESFRHGTLSLYGAFIMKTGEVLRQKVESHTSSEFVAFLTDIVTNRVAGRR